MARLNSIDVDMRPVLELARRILSSPKGRDCALHITAMIADRCLAEIIPHPRAPGLMAVPSLELMRLADEAGVERVA